MTMMEGIVDHKIDTEVAVSKDNMYVVTRRGQKRPRKKHVVGSSWYVGRMGVNHGFT